jgi:hypothetical protein
VSSLPSVTATWRAGSSDSGMAIQYTLPGVIGWQGLERQGVAGFARDLDRDREVLKLPRLDSGFVGCQPSKSSRGPRWDRSVVGLYRLGELCVLTSTNRLGNCL